jgi:hypothetical protein
MDWQAIGLKYRVRICKPFKGSLTPDFRLQVFFHESLSPGPQSIPLGPFRIFSKIRGDIRELMFITGHRCILLGLSILRTVTFFSFTFTVFV